MDAICSPVIPEQWFSSFLFLPHKWLELPFPAPTMERAEWSYILSCRRIWNKPVTFSEPQGKGRVIARQRKLCLTSDKWFMFSLSKSQQTSVSKKGCWCWISISDTTQKKICSRTVLNKIQNCIASWVLLAVFPFPPPKITLEISVPAQYFVWEAGFCKMFVSFHSLSTITVSPHKQQQWPKPAMKIFNIVSLYISFRQWATKLKQPWETWPSYSLQSSIRSWAGGDIWVLIFHSKGSSSFPFLFDKICRFVWH